MLSSVTKMKVEEACKHLLTPEQVDATILRLHQYRSTMWPRPVRPDEHLPDVIRELAQIHNQLVAGDDVIISPNSLRAQSIAAAMCSVAGRKSPKEM